MIINSFNIEFGYELIAVIPYAYYLFKQGKLEKTISGKLSITRQCLHAHSLSFNHPVLLFNLPALAVKRLIELFNLVPESSYGSLRLFEQAYHINFGPAQQ